MTTFLNVLTIILITCFISCSQTHGIVEKTISPGGKYYIISSVNRNDQSKENYADVIVRLYERDGKFLSELNTHAGDANSWAIGWMLHEDTIVLNSSDIGAYAWRIENNQFIEIELNDELKKRADFLMSEKYK